MGEAEVQAAVEALYDGATASDSWSYALSSLGRLAGGIGARFFLWDRSAGSFVLSAYGGDYDPAWHELYLRHYSVSDPRRRLVERVPAGAVVPCHLFFGEQCVRHSEFYNDYLLPSGIRYSAFGRFRNANGRVAMFGIHRGPQQEPFDPAAIDGIRRVVPHLRRAARVYCEFHRLRLENASLAEALNRAPCGVIVVDRSGRGRHFNRAAEEIVRRGDGLLVRWGELTAAASAEAAALRHMIAAAIDRVVGQGALAGGSLRVTRAGGEPPYEVFMAPLSRRDAGPEAMRMAILFIRDPGRRPEAAASRLARRYGLTPAEARLAAAMAAGKSPRDYADETKLSINTVRWTLKQVFAKTETRRQPDLVRLLLSEGAELTGR